MATVPTTMNERRHMNNQHRETEVHGSVKSLGLRTAKSEEKERGKSQENDLLVQQLDERVRELEVELARKCELLESLELLDLRRPRLTTNFSTVEGLGVQATQEIEELTAYINELEATLATQVHLFTSELSNVKELFDMEQKKNKDLNTALLKTNGGDKVAAALAKKWNQSAKQLEDMRVAKAEVERLLSRCASLESKLNERQALVTEQQRKIDYLVVQYAGVEQLPERMSANISLTKQGQKAAQVAAERLRLYEDQCKSHEQHSAALEQKLRQEVFAHTSLAKKTHEEAEVAAKRERFCIQLEEEGQKYEDRAAGAEQSLCEELRAHASFKENAHKKIKARTSELEQLREELQAHVKAEESAKVFQDALATAARSSEDCRVREELRETQQELQGMANASSAAQAIIKLHFDENEAWTQERSRLEQAYLSSEETIAKLKVLKKSGSQPKAMGQTSSEGLDVPSASSSAKAPVARGSTPPTALPTPKGSIHGSRGSTASSASTATTAATPKVLGMKSTNDFVEMAALRRKLADLEKAQVASEANAKETKLKLNKANDELQEKRRIQQSEQKWKQELADSAKKIEVDMKALSASNALATELRSKSALLAKQIAEKDCQLSKNLSQIHEQSQELRSQADQTKQLTEQLDQLRRHATEKDNAEDRWREELFDEERRHLAMLE